MATRTFDNNGGAGDGKWSTGANWDDGSGGTGVPAAGDTAIIDANCTLDIDTPSLAKLTVNSGKTLSAGDYDIATTGDFVLDGVLTAGASVMTVGGHLDWDGSNASFTRGTSQVVLTGTGQIKDNSNTRDFYDLSIAASGKTTTLWYAYPNVHHLLTLGTGTVSSTGSWIVLRGLGTVVSNAGATVNVSLMYRPDSNGTVNIAGGTYAAGIVVGFDVTDSNLSVDYVLAGDLTCSWLSVQNQKWGICTFDANDYDITTTGNCTLGDSSTQYLTTSLGSGTLIIGGVLTISKGQYTTVTVNLESATIQVAGNVTVNSAVTVNCGTSTLKLDGTGAQTINLAGKTLNNVEVDNTGATVTFSDSFTAAQLKLVAGNSVMFTNGKTYTLTDVDWQGSSGSLITLRSTSSGSTWALVVSGTQTVKYVDVQDSDASGGSQIKAYNSVNSGNNTNWSFLTSGWETTYFYYDSLDRQVAVVDAANEPTYFYYDKVSNRTVTVDALNHPAYFVYDEVNRLKAQVDALGNATYFGYDGVGNRLSVTDPKNQVTYYAYDDVNRLVQVTDPEGGVSRSFFNRAGERATDVVER